MADRCITRLGALAVALVVASAVPGSAAGQAASGEPAVTGAKLPRTPDGRPDLQGLWNTATLTPLERPGTDTTLVLTDEEAGAIEAKERAFVERRARPSRADRSAPPIGGDGSTGPAGNVGGYNTFWIDRGTQAVRVDGQWRSSIVVDPPDGRVPPLRPEALKRNTALRAGPAPGAPSDAARIAAAERGEYDDIEQRPLGERCILGFGSTAGPPALPVLYNNFKQIVQTRDHVMILNEMVHDARIIRLSGRHVPTEIRKWMGDSVGRWDGDTLVVETANFTGKTRFRGSSESLRVTERFTLVDEKTILYRFTVEDPATWERPWSGEYPWAAAEPGELLYEYACHEANYALGDILRGARLLEAEAAATAPSKK